MTTFSADVSKHISKSSLLLESVFQEATQRTINEAQTPTYKGGNMRVDTGFLRNSGKAQINSVPSGASENTGERLSDWDNTNTVLTINNAKLGDSIYFGWTANYARYRENKDGFVRLAAQNWNRTVQQVVRDLKAKFR